MEYSQPGFSQPTAVARALGGILSRRKQKQPARHENFLRLLHQEHGRVLLAYAYRLTGDRFAAEDVVQETLLRAWQNAETLLNGRGSTRGWLLTVTRNLVIDRIRATAARPQEVAEGNAVPQVTEDHAGSVVESQFVYQALATLSPGHRAVLAELYYRGRTAAEAGRALGIPEGTVKSRAHNALRSLRETVTALRDNA